MVIIRNSNEDETVKYFLKQVGPYFEVDQEVSGVHISGKRKRIDAVIYPRELILQKDFPNIPIGIEFKPTDLDDGNKRQVIELYHQAIIYRHTRFNLRDSLRFIPLILIYPPSMHYLNHSENTSNEFNSGFKYFANRLAGLFFIGEISLNRDNKYIQFMIEVCGTTYYRLDINNHFHKQTSNWGFEVYEREIGKMVEQGKVKVKEYETEVLEVAHRLGI